jgi:hypothetical protein
VSPTYSAFGVEILRTSRKNSGDEFRILFRKAVAELVVRNLYGLFK